MYAVKNISHSKIWQQFRPVRGAGKGDIWKA
nr:MAG TPA: hypothetical protein [Caudoviricetes sp.]